VKAAGPAARSAVLMEVAGSTPSWARSRLAHRAAPPEPSHQSSKRPRVSPGHG